MTLSTEPWHHWEDWRNGLYLRAPIDGERVVLSVELLSDPDQFLEVAHEMVREWSVAAQHNLVDLASHRRSWTGQASCCYAHKATVGETVQAWGQLSNATQGRANRVADIVVNAYLRGGRNYGQTLFGD